MYMTASAAASAAAAATDRERRAGAQWGRGVPGDHGQGQAPGATGGPAD